MQNFGGTNRVLWYNVFLIEANLVVGLQKLKKGTPTSSDLLYPIPLKLVIS